MTMVLGLTGGIATGKSTADAFFRKRKIPIVDADQIAHHIYDQGKPGYQKIIAAFGKEFVTDQKIDRQKLGRLVFSDKEKMKLLNSIALPLIYQEIDYELASYRQKQAKLVVLDAPILFESHGENRCDKILVIYLPEEKQIQRLMQRNSLSYEDAKKRIDSQMPLAEKVARADYVVDNTGTIKTLEEKLAQLLIKIKIEG